MLTDKVVLITGGARRIGAAIARCLHARGARLVLHYRSSRDEALALQGELEAARRGSVALVQADLLDTASFPRLIACALTHFGRLDGLVNNASSFFPDTVGQIDDVIWDDLIGSNLKAPLFLAQAAAPALQASGGAIVGIVDIHAERPLKGHVVYSLAKAGHAQLVRTLALELAPRVRVNGVAPGSNIWPEGVSVFTPELRAAIAADIPLGRIGEPRDLARAVAFLLSDDAAYITGQVLAVDGGRSVVQ